MGRAASALAAVLASTLSVECNALPRWSWDTLGDMTYIHCANTTGEWNDNALHTYVSVCMLCTTCAPFVRHRRLLAKFRMHGTEGQVEACLLAAAPRPRLGCHLSRSGHALACHPPPRRARATAAEWPRCANWFSVEGWFPRLHLLTASPRLTCNLLSSIQHDTVPTSLSVPTSLRCVTSRPRYLIIAAGH
jgi:hypothetical protein